MIYLSARLALVGDRVMHSARGVFGSERKLDFCSFLIVLA